MKILIIGGSTDIGISLAQYLNQKHHEVIITYHDHNPHMPNINAIQCDITKEEEVVSLIKKLGRIDCLINMAAISKDSTLMESSKTDFMNVLEVNLVGSYIAAKAYAKYNQNGLIINMSSTDGIDTYNEYNMFYAVSKSGLIHLTKCLAQSINSTVYCICPNWINSSSTKNIDQKYLSDELKRIHQARLIEINELNESIDKIINSKEKSGTVFRIDIKGGKLWTEKVL